MMWGSVPCNYYIYVPLTKANHICYCYAPASLALVCE